MDTYKSRHFCEGRNDRLLGVNTGIIKKIPKDVHRVKKICILVKNFKNY